MLWLDLRYSIRKLRNSPGFAAVSIAVLGTGIAFSTAMFSIVRAVLLAPLPYSSPERIVQLASLDRRSGEQRTLIPYADALDFAQRLGDFSEMGSYRAALRHTSQRGPAAPARGPPSPGTLVFRGRGPAGKQALRRSQRRPLAAAIRRRSRHRRTRDPAHRSKLPSSRDHAAGIQFPSSPGDHGATA